MTSIHRPECQGALLVALPYPSGKLHQGNVAGTFLPADVMRRYGRMLYKKFRVISGLDAHGTGVMLEFPRETRSSGIHGRRREYLAYLGRYHITPDQFEPTCRYAHRHYVRRYMRRLSERIQIKVLPMRYCTHCRMQCSDRLLWDTVHQAYWEKLHQSGITPSAQLVCARCRQPPLSKTAQYLVLKYLPERTKAAQRNFPSLRDVDEEGKILTRYLPWGVATNRQSGEVYYVWPEALLSYSRMAKTTRVRFFFGKDNLYYHGLILRQMAQGIPYAQRHNTYCREHLHGANRAKISSSRPVQSGPIEPWDRLALILCDPRTQDTIYSPARRIEAKKILHHHWINTIRRIRGILQHKRLTPRSYHVPGFGDIERDYATAMRHSQLRKALECVERYHRSLVQLVMAQVNDPRKTGDTALSHYGRRFQTLIEPLYPAFRAMCRSSPPGRRG